MSTETTEQKESKRLYSGDHHCKLCGSPASFIDEKGHIILNELGQSSAVGMICERCSLVDEI